MTPYELTVLRDIVSDVREQCYDPESMEYWGDEPCVRCRLVSLIADAVQEAAA